MCNSPGYEDKSKFGLYLSLWVITLPLLVMHFISVLYFALDEISNVTFSIALMIFVTHITNSVFMYLTLPWTKRTRGLQTLKAIPKIPRNKRDSIISKDHLLKRNNFREYIDGNQVILKNWRIWRILRPPKTVHWYTCDHWVQEMDHHWMWLSWCIGKGNYCYFISFLITLNIIHMLVFLQSILAIFYDDQSEDAQFIVDNLKTHVYMVLMSILSIIMLWFILPLLLFHFYLIKNKMTTNEYFKVKEKVSHYYIIVYYRR